MAGFNPALAEGGFWEWVTGGPKDTDPAPAKTLRAPFADAPADEQAGGGDVLTRLPENQIPMDQPHRAKAQIQAWVITAVSEAMSFPAGDIDADLARTKDDFTPEAREQYLAFMRKTALLQPLTKGGLSLRSVAREEPFLLNEGAVNGHYRWLYEIPVLSTYLALDADGYLEAKEQNKELVIRVQVGRSGTTKDPEGLIIETWEGKLVD